MARDWGGFDGWREAIEAAELSLHSLSPAECLLVLDPEGADPKELIRVTLLDLIAKKAIRFERRQRRTAILRRKVDDPYLIAGTGSRHGHAKDHEHLILAVIRREKEISLKNFARAVARQLRKARAFNDAYVVEELSKAGLIVEERRFLLFRRKFLSEKGERVRDVLQDLRSHAERHMDGWLNADRDKAALFLALVGTNILIMPEILEKLDAAFAPLITVSHDVEFEFGGVSDAPLPDGFFEPFSDACDAVRVDGAAFDSCFDSLGSGAFDGGGSGGGSGGDSGGGGGDSGGGGDGGGGGGGD